MLVLQLLYQRTRKIKMIQTETVEFKTEVMDHLIDRMDYEIVGRSNPMPRKMREETKEKLRNAKSKNIKGYVKNLPSGGVEAFFQGASENVNEMIELVKEGPSASNVDNVEIEEKELQDYENFRVTG